ncbi:MAG: aldo/keto reductase [Kovacikia sp.]
MHYGDSISKELGGYSLVKYREFGNTGLKVSVLGFGGASLGSRSNRKKSIKALNEAFAQGINLYDTAPFYGQGESERIIGNVFKKRRDKVIITTKIGLYPSAKLQFLSKFKPIVRSFFQMLPGNEKRLMQKSVQSFMMANNRIEFEPSTIVKSVESSLKRLQCDYIDILLLHVLPHPSDFDGVIEKLKLLRQQGKIRYFGACPHSLEEAISLLRMSENDFSTLQIRLNMLEVEAIDSCLPISSGKGLAIIAREPFAQGKLLKPKLNNASELEFVGHKYDSRFDFLAKDNVRTLPQAALQFLIQTERIAAILTGMSSVSHMRENLAALDLPELTSEEIKMIRTVTTTRGSIQNNLNTRSIQG